MTTPNRAEQVAINREKAETLELHPDATFELENIGTDRYPDWKLTHRLSDGWVYSIVNITADGRVRGF
jgi:hypothetical protein